MTDLIFVYGSLMSKVPSRASEWLAQNASLLCMDAVHGQLFDLGSYPGLVVNANSPELVIGEVHRLKKREQALIYLDKYEGVAVPVPEYERRLCLTLQGFHCWVYEFLPYKNVFPLISSGNYNTYYPTNSRHLAFIQQSDASSTN